MRITPLQQRIMVRRHAEQALDDLARLIVTHRAEILRRNELRTNSIGIHEYGDRTWHLPTLRLVSEAIDELADGLFYLTPPLARTAGDLVWDPAGDTVYRVAL